MRCKVPLMRRTTTTLVLLLFTAMASAAEPARKPSAERGYHWLTEKAYLPPDFDQEVFDELWTVWEPALKAKAEKADVATRRKMAFARYGLTQRPGDALLRTLHPRSHRARPGALPVPSLRPGSARPPRGGGGSPSNGRDRSRGRRWAVSALIAKRHVEFPGRLVQRDLFSQDAQFVAVGSRP